jgi:protein-L-isoaspartate(D-aspartate) O-methyltransferase
MGAFEGPERSARRRMVRTQLLHPVDGREAVRDPRVLAAMEAVPRHAFVPPALREAAYEDGPLPIGQGQSISQPYMVARMTELLRVEPDSKVLEVGTGSGYQAAVLAELTPRVFTVEVVPDLSARAADALRGLGYASVRFRVGDGGLGWPEEAPFDRILVTCAAPALPPRLWEQLRGGGRLVYPHGEPYSFQWLVVAEKTPDGRCVQSAVMPVLFVPMTA